MTKKEILNKRSKEWNKNNPQKRSDIKKKWDQKNKKKNAELSREYRKRNPDKHKKRNKEWSKKHPEKQHLYIISTKYKVCGFIKDDYLKLYAKQKGKCGICKTEIPKLFVDHCHKKLVVRGLLCRHCNSMLGFAKDNIEVLKSAIKYLRKKYD